MNEETQIKILPWVNTNQTLSNWALKSPSSSPSWISSPLSALLICIYYFLLILLRPTTVFATWDMMTQTQRRKRKSFSQEFWIWSNGLVSKIVLLRKISRKSSIFSVDISLLVFLLSSLRSFNCHQRIYECEYMKVIYLNCG